MGRWKHITIGERESFMVLLDQGKGVRQIAEETGKSPSTVSRELRRNSGEGPYSASEAQRRADERRGACGRKKRLADPGLRALVQEKILVERWSPEQVSGRPRLEAGVAPGTATICRAIAAREQDTPELRHTARGASGRLRRKGKRRKKGGEPEGRGKIKVPRDIGERPKETEGRSRLGGWEADTVLGRAGGPCLVTLAGRRSRYLVGGVVESRSALPVAREEIRSLSGQPLETVAPDRGKEFADWADVEGAQAVEFYCALPRHPWHRGTSENTNGLVREYFPKGTDFSKIGPEEVQEVYDALNMRPRKCLGYRTPYEIHNSIVLQLI